MSWNALHDWKHFLERYRCTPMYHKKTLYMRIHIKTLVRVLIKSMLVVSFWKSIISGGGGGGGSENQSVGLYLALYLPACTRGVKVNNITSPLLTLVLLVANLEFGQYKMMQKKKRRLKNYWNPGTWVLIWQYSARDFQWIATWQGLDDFRKSLHPWVLDGRVKSYEQQKPLLFWSMQSDNNSYCLVSE